MTLIRRDQVAIIAAQAAELERCRHKAVDQINREIGDRRARHVTIAPGQDLIYAEKRREAEAYLQADPEPGDLQGFPLLAAEVVAGAESAWHAAQLIINTAQIWAGVAAALEVQRLGAIAAVSRAQTPAEIDATVAAFRATLGA